MSLWRELLETAVQAPSPHNVQPWRIRILNDQEADLLIDSKRTLPKEDPTGSFIILTMGMFIEGLRLLAANEHHRLEHEMYHEPSWYAAAILKATEQTFLPFARLKLSPDEDVEADYGPSLFLIRRTSRVSLLPAPVPAEATEKFRALAQQWGQRYEQISDASAIERILNQNTEALFEDLNNPDYHDEIVEWFRFSDKSARYHRDGLDYRCMNTSRVSYWLAARLPKLLMLPLVCSLLSRQYRAQLGTVPTIGLLAGKFWEPESAFKTGPFAGRDIRIKNRYIAGN